jgi:hypothetical protein
MVFQFLAIRNPDRDSPKRAVLRIRDVYAGPFLSSRKNYLRCSSRIQIFSIPDPGVKKHRIRIRNTAIKPGSARILIRIQRNMDPQTPIFCSAISHDGLFLFSLPYYIHGFSIFRHCIGIVLFNSNKGKFFFFILL